MDEEFDSSGSHIKEAHLSRISFEQDHFNFEKLKHEQDVRYREIKREKIKRRRGAERAERKRERKQHCIKRREERSEAKKLRLEGFKMFLDAFSTKRN